MHAEEDDALQRLVTRPLGRPGWICVTDAFASLHGESVRTSFEFSRETREGVNAREKGSILFSLKFSSSLGTPFSVVVKSNETDLFSVPSDTEVAVGLPIAAMPYCQLSLSVRTTGERRREPSGAGLVTAECEYISADGLGRAFRDLVILVEHGRSRLRVQNGCVCVERGPIVF